MGIISAKLHWQELSAERQGAPGYCETADNQLNLNDVLVFRAFFFFSVPVNAILILPNIQNMVRMNHPTSLLAAPSQCFYIPVGLCAFYFFSICYAPSGVI